MRLRLGRESTTFKWPPMGKSGAGVPCAQAVVQCLGALWFACYHKYDFLSICEVKGMQTRAVRRSDVPAPLQVASCGESLK